MTEKAVLVGVCVSGQSPREAELSLQELRRLSETAGAAAVATLFQRLERRNPRTLIGQGKVLELARTARGLGARTVLFDHELSAAQHKALERAVEAKVVDRTRLILDIFARRARTKEGELQVELAQLSYLLPRLTGSWRAYSQQVGGIGTRGPGERQLEYERRHIRSRIEHLKRAIGRLGGQRALQRRRRLAVPVPQVALVGYTNAGKSTLLNSLCGGAGAYADDKLFSTLDPTARRARLPAGGWAVFTDTVGFIQNLPTALIAAFHSTLEEASSADCLVHVIDGSAEDPGLQRRTVARVLEEIGAGAVPVVEAVNKSDLLDAETLQRLLGGLPGAVPLCAARGEGLRGLLERVEQRLSGRWMLRELELPLRRAGLLREAYRSAQVLSQSSGRGVLRLRLRVTPENWQRLRALARSDDGR